MIPTFSSVNVPTRMTEDASTAAAQMQRLMSCYARHVEKIGKTHGGRLKGLMSEVSALNRRFGDAANAHRIYNDASDYATDAAQRFVLTLDTLRERGNNDIAHEAAGTPPVLIYKTEVAMDGRNLPRPVNYVLLKILPPEGVEVFDWKRPYMIIDPARRTWRRHRRL